MARMPPEVLGKLEGGEVPEAEEDFRGQQVQQHDVAKVDVRHGGEVPGGDRDESGGRERLQADKDSLGGGAIPCLPGPQSPPEQGLRTPYFLQRDLDTDQCHSAHGSALESRC